MNQLVLGSRKSRLALWQSRTVARRIQESCPDTSVVLREYTTAGDRQTSQPLPAIGGKGLFTAELDQAILAGDVDFAVHSLKDLPTKPEPGMQILPVLYRQDPRDVLVSRDGLTLEELPDGAVVGTSSYRRQSQLLALRPDLKIHSIRGNVPTRIAKAISDDPSQNGLRFDGVILAAAGVVRLEMQDQISQWIDLDDVMPAPGQAMIAATFRSDDRRMKDLLAPLLDKKANACVRAERCFLAAMGGGCSSPVASFARWNGEQFVLRGRVASPDGRSVVTLEKTCQTFDPDDDQQIQQLAYDLARQVLKSGGRKILDDLPDDGSKSGSPVANAVGVGIVSRVSSLAGKRVMVTRAAGQSDTLMTMLAEQQAIPVSIPLIDFRSVADAEQTIQSIADVLPQFDWLVFSSSNAVHFFFQLLDSNLDPSGRKLVLPKSIRIASVGQQTAKAVELRGYRSDFVPDESCGQALAEQLPCDSSETVLFPAAVKSHGSLKKTLGDRVESLVHLPVYETVGRALEETEKQTLDQAFDVVTFASPSAVDSYCKIITDSAQRLRNVTVACIGSSTADRCRERSIPVDVVPEKCGVEEMVLALAMHFESPGNQ